MPANIVLRLASHILTHTHTHMYNPQAAQATPTDELYYPSYVWITLGWYADRWWTQEVANDPTVNCTDAQFETLLRRTLAIQQLPTAENRTGSTNVSLVSGQLDRLLLIIIAQS